MSGFFNQLSQARIINKWADILDWLLNDNRFSQDKGWDKNAVSKFTKKVSRLPNLKKENFVYKSLKEMNKQRIFPKTRPKEIKILLAGNESKGRDLVRHIRNGIAHGKTRIIKKEGGNYIEIKDYNTRHQQTAYIYIPIDYIYKFYEIYSQIEKSNQ